MTLDSSLTREGVRSAFGAILETNLVGASLPGQVFYPYKKAKLDGESPITMLMSAGMGPSSAGQRITFTARNMRWYLEVWNFVLWGSADGVYAEDDAEDIIDQMALIVLDSIEEYSDPNHTAELTQPSAIRSILMDGEGYLWEAFPIAVEING
jgi:hypothetical protein